MAAKTRPAVVLIADNLNAPRSLIIHIPITKQNRGSELEVPLGHLRFLDPASVANVQGIGSLPSVRFERGSALYRSGSKSRESGVGQSLRPVKRR